MKKTIAVMLGLFLSSLVLGFYSGELFPITLNQEKLMKRLGATKEKYGAIMEIEKRWATFLDQEKN